MNRLHMYDGTWYCASCAERIMYLARVAGWRLSFFSKVAGVLGRRAGHGRAGRAPL